MKKSFIIILSLMFILTGCGVFASVETDSQVVELGGADLVEIDLEMSAGELILDGGAKELVEANFSYNKPSLRPEVSYNLDGNKGHLIIENENSLSIVGNIKNEWNLKLNNKVKKDLNVKLGAGEGTLKLGDLNISELSLKLGAGEVTLDFTGDWEQDLDASIKGGVGEATLILPKDVGVKARAVGGIGEIHVAGLTKDGDYYVNEAFGKSDITLNIDVKGGIGEINLELE